MATTTAYKRCEKRWKALRAEQAHGDPHLVDVRNLSAGQTERVRTVGTWQWTSESPERPILAFDGFGDLHDGFFVIPDALDAATQLSIAHACLYVHARAAQSLFCTCPLSNGRLCSHTTTLCLATTNEYSRTEYAEAPHVTNIHLQNAQVADIWKSARASRPSDPSAAAPLSKLHWAACGYHYEWTARKYFRDRFSPVPALLEQIAVQCARACGMSIAAEAVIVNFYKKSSTMGGHQDDVEYTMDHPVVSLSLGSSSVFLKGGLTKDDAPLEVLLRSGDLAVLGGRSRLSFHGVAKVLPVGDFAIPPEQWAALTEGKSSDEVEDLVAVRAYLGTQRININVRQVYPSPPDADEKPQTKRKGSDGVSQLQSEREKKAKQ